MNRHTEISSVHINTIIVGWEEVEIGCKSNKVRQLYTLLACFECRPYLCQALCASVSEEEDYRMIMT